MVEIFVYLVTISVPPIIVYDISKCIINLLLPNIDDAWRAIIPIAIGVVFIFVWLGIVRIIVNKKQGDE
jgi:hypothetical protein